jgi:YVTN family beta-propeller protein
MLEERLRRATEALERSVAEVDAAQRLQALGRRRRRQRTTTAALAWVAAAAVLAGVVFAVGIARRPDPQPGPTARPDPTAPARVVETLRLFGDPVAMAVRADDVWVAGDNPTWVTRWVTPTNPMTRETPTIALSAAPTRLAAAEDAVWVLTPADNRVVRIDPATNQVAATIGVGRAPGAVTVAGGVVWVALPERGLGRIDPAGNRSTVVDVPRCCDGALAAGEGALWVANHGDGTLVRVDAATGRVAARIPLPRTTQQRPHQVAVGDGAIWVTSAGARRAPPTCSGGWTRRPTRSSAPWTSGPPRPGASPTASPPATAPYGSAG